MKKKRKNSLVGLVWYGYVGEYKHPPCYIIPKKGYDGIFVSDIFKKFFNKKVRITIEEV